MDIQNLEEEFKQLKDLPPLEMTVNNTGISNEQLICESQIYILKERAMQKELIADEVRRFSILFEVLEKIKKSTDNVPDMAIQKMTDIELLQLVGNNGTAR